MYNEYYPRINVIKFNINFNSWLYLYLNIFAFIATSSSTRNRIQQFTSYIPLQEVKFLHLCCPYEGRKCCVCDIYTILISSHLKLRLAVLSVSLTVVYFSD